MKNRDFILAFKDNLERKQLGFQIKYKGTLDLIAKQQKLINRDRAIMEVEK